MLDRYCDSTCQHDHWRRVHKQMCKKIHRGGNAEQYHADKKYKEAVAAAVEASRTTRRAIATSFHLRRRSRTKQGAARHAENVVVPRRRA